MCFESAPDYTGAAAIQSAAANKAAEFQQQMYQQARADVAPWREAGGVGVKQIGGILGLPGYAPVDPTSTLQATPGYQWGLGQGVQALDRSAASRGMALSGPQRNAIQQFGQNYALTQAWQPYMSALQQLSGQGLSAGGMSGNWGLQTGQMVGQDWMAAANAQAQAMVQQQIAQNQQSSGLFGGLGSLIGLGLSAFGGGGFGGGGSLFGGGATGMGLSQMSNLGAGGYGAFNAAPGGGWLPAMAGGGHALPDRPYIVGEKGPELFVPKQAGFVVPNYALAGRSSMFPYDPAGEPMTERPPKGWRSSDFIGGGYAA